MAEHLENLSCLAFLVACLWLQIFVYVSGEQASLYSNFKNDHGSWTALSERGKTKNGWVYKKEQKQFEVCDTEIRGANNRLISPFIDVRDANVAQIQLNFTIKSCDDVIKSGQSSECTKELLKIGYIASDSPTKKPRDTNFNYVPIESQNLNQPTPSGGVVQEAVGFLYLTDFTNDGVFIVIHDEGSCSTISDLKLSYYYCPETTRGLAHYDKTTSPRDPVVYVDGKCMPNAESSYKPKSSCTSSGKWQQETSSCKCSPGYEFTQNQCKPCTQGYYKSEVGNNLCKVCPYGSSSTRSSDQRRAYYPLTTLDSTKCECRRDKFRLSDDNPNAPCFGLPSPPRSVKVHTSGRTAEISWTAPDKDGGYVGYPVGLFFTIRCISCHKDTLTYQPNKLRIMENFVRVSGLKPDTLYTFKVYSENQISGKVPTEKKSSADVTFNTDPPSYVQKLRVSKEHGWGGPSVSILWEPPFGYSNPKYCVRLGQSGKFQFFRVNTTRYVPIGLDRGTYTFDVSVYGCEGPFTAPVTAQISEERVMSQERVQRITLTIVFLVLVFALLLIVLSVAMCFYRQKKGGPGGPGGLGGIGGYHWTNASHLVEYPCHAPHQSDNEFVKLPVGQGFVDPRQFEPIERMLNEFVREIGSECVKWDESEVLIDSPTTSRTSGILSWESDSEDEKRSVSLKFLRDYSSPSSWRNFAIEAATMSQLSHPNVLMLYGVVINDATPILVTETADMGPLDALLSNHSSKFSTMQIVHMLRGVASGLQYLSEGDYVHKVIRGSNVLVTKSQVCKIGGFDVRAKMEEQLVMGNGESDILDSMAPWSAIEVLTGKNFSSASDVWAFASLMWECISGGQQPFVGASINEICKHLEQGHRLPVPNDSCPPVLYEMMTACWSKDPKHRPWFSSIRQHLEELMTSPRHMIGNPLGATLAARSIGGSGTLAPVGGSVGLLSGAVSTGYVNASGGNAAATLGVGSNVNNNYFSFGRSHNDLLASYCNNRYQQQQHQQQKPSPVNPTIQQMLAELKLAEKYLTLFENNNFRYVDELSKDISKDFLKVLGINSRKDRQKIVAQVEYYKRCSDAYNSISNPNSPLHYASSASPINLCSY